MITVLNSKNIINGFYPRAVFVTDLMNFMRVKKHNVNVDDYSRFASSVAAYVMADKALITIIGLTNVEISVDMPDMSVEIELEKRKSLIQAFAFQSIRRVKAYGRRKKKSKRS